MNEIILEIDSLSKRYGQIQAVENLSLNISRGTVCGILGPNGSGKTTSLSMLLGIVRPDSGSYSWFGGRMNGAKARKRIGALLETPNFYPWMNAEENLRILSHIKGVNPSLQDELLDIVGLADRKHSPFNTYSLGMKQRLALAGALVGDPDVLILDEPANGLDPQGISEVRSVVRQIAALGKTIIMASHILDEVEKVCTHVAILKKGVLLAYGSTGSILDNCLECEASCDDPDRLFAVFSQLSFIKNLRQNGQGVVLFEIPVGQDPASLNQLAFSKGLILRQLHCKRRSLEAEFLKITN